MHLTSSRHGRFPRPRSQIQATPRRKAPPNGLTPLCPCSQAASAALLTASSLCIAGSQSKRAMAESPRPWPGQGRWGMRGDGMRGRERERERIKERERARGMHCFVVARRAVLCCRYVCRMHACESPGMRCEVAATADQNLSQLQSTESHENIGPRKKWSEGKLFSSARQI